jgi:hypothetical protein
MSLDNRILLPILAKAILIQLLDQASTFRKQRQTDDANIWNLSLDSSSNNLEVASLPATYVATDCMKVYGQIHSGRLSIRKSHPTLSRY